METHLPQEQKQAAKKGGRPVKSTKRNCTLVVRVTDTERQLIAGKARQAGLSLSAWFRTAAQQAVVVARLRPEELAALRMLSGLSNNLNQLTRLAHRQGLFNLQDRCRHELDRLHYTLRLLRRDDRKSDDR